MNLDELKNQFDQTRILITGGAGFVGSNLARLLLRSNEAVSITIVDNLLSSERENIPEDDRVEFKEASITSDELLEQLEDEFDYVFHLATYHGNQSSIHDPLADHENNTLTTLKLMNRLQNFKRLKKVVYSSAGCSVAEKTFDDAKPTPESAPISLIQDSPYSISKVIGEFYSVYFFRQYGLPTVRARFQNVYGPGEILGAGQWRGTPATIWRNVTPTFIYKALKGEPLPIENNGIATRDFIHVDDIARGLLTCALKGRPGEAYNLATGEETSILNLATMINKLTGNKAGFQQLPKRPWDHSGKRFGCPHKSKQDLGFSSSIPLEIGIHKTIEWTKQKRPLINRCIEKHRFHLDQLTLV
ncbi:MAG: NAD-dependent epimerase/dehydratase family protein [Elusimicrobia bacterium]|nr:NAD-dependent epimerase/dehydratase family protein [Candidatus Obscuribacterium magneticum]